MQRPTVSLIVPTFNRSHYLRIAIDSLAKQTRQFAELLVVDDGSSDDTPEVAPTLPGNPIYLRKENGGRAAAINHGVRQAKGDLIWIFDDDDVALPSALATLIAPFEEPGREVGFTYSPWYLCDELPDGTLKVEGTSKSPLLGGRAFFHEMLFGCFTQGNAMLIPRRCYDAIGPMREDLIRSQDHEYMLRLSREFDAVPIAEPTFYWRRHRGPRGAGSGKMFAVENINRNWHLYRQKIFIDVHRDFALQDYLPEERQRDFPANTREAQLTRSVVMACQGLWQLAIPEMVELASSPLARAPTVHEEAVLARLAASLTPDALVDLAATPQSEALAQLDKSALGKLIVLQMLRAGRWHFHNHWRDGERVQALQIGRSLIGGLGALRVAIAGTEHLFQGRARP
jgi:glycosyltransferase involved in cell wall biosynthesis